LQILSLCEEIRDLGRNGEKIGFGMVRLRGCERL
jgi:hypothetical protein